MVEKSMPDGNNNWGHWTVQLLSCTGYTARFLNHLQFGSLSFCASSWLSVFLSPDQIIEGEPGSCRVKRSNIWNPVFYYNYIDLLEMINNRIIKIYELMTCTRTSWSKCTFVRCFLCFFHCNPKNLEEKK